MFKDCFYMQMFNKTFIIKKLASSNTPFYKCLMCLGIMRMLKSDNE